MTLSGAQADLGNFQDRRARSRLVETGSSRRIERRVRLDLDNPGDAIGLQRGVSSSLSSAGQTSLTSRSPMTSSLDHRMTSGVHVMPENGLGLFADWGLDHDKRFLSHVANKAELPFHIGFSIGARLLLKRRARQTCSASSSTDFTPTGLSRIRASPARSVERARRRPGSVRGRAGRWARCPRRLGSAGNELP